MLTPAITAFFKYRVVRSIIVLACWRPYEQTQFVREISEHGFAATFTCDPATLDVIHPHGLQGVIYFKQSDDSVLEKLKSEHFCGRYVWLVVGDSVPVALGGVRYDAEIALLRTKALGNDTSVPSNQAVNFEDIHVQLATGVSAYLWGYWTRASGLQLLYERERILRRFDFRGYPLRIAAPLGQYSDEWYNGSYAEYVVDETLSELDAGIRSGYAASALVVQLLNATEVLITTKLWGVAIHNDSMQVMLLHGTADLSGAILRILSDRVDVLDYVMSVWPFSVGFTYLAERKSSSNMFIEPFTVGVWWTSLLIGFVLAAALRVTARSQEEKDGSYYDVLATFLQQDASAVPKGISGRWTFTVMSVCAMLVHAYYTSAIVSALMSAGSGGPDSLRSLADSKYAIGSLDYDYMRYLFFDVETTWDDLEYLKKKKKTSKFYQGQERGVQLIEDGTTAFHMEYNEIFPHFKTFSDDQICKLQYIDTIPEVMTWITATPNGQYTNTFRAAGAWLSEVGIGKRLVTRLRTPTPACRAQLLAERVKIGDIAPLLGLSAFGAILSLLILGLEILIARRVNCGKGKRLLSADRNSIVTVDNGEE